MKLRSMKIDPKEREEKYSAEPAKMDLPVYPYGLEVRLDEDALEKLGLEKMPEVGGSMLLMARVDVTGCSVNEHAQGGKQHKHKSLTLQITDLGLKADGDGVDEEKLAGKLYTSKES
jgi:hypothetical protein